MSENTNNYTLVIDEEKLNEMLEYYKGYLTESNSEYVINRCKLSSCSITFYKTLKVLFQGSNAFSEYSKWTNEFSNNENPSIYDEYQNKAAIGTDECGNGDYFGPITCCATYVSINLIDKLRQLGVKDSKMLTDDRIKIIAKKILSYDIPYSVRILQPSTLNNLKNNDKFESDNLNYIKANLHNEVINDLIKKHPNLKKEFVIIDQFCSEKKYYEHLENKEMLYSPILIEKGERANISVAASSILARYAFLIEMDKLNKKYNIEFPKGSGELADIIGKNIVEKYGEKELYNIAKIKFKNTERILNK